VNHRAHNSVDLKKLNPASEVRNGAAQPRLLIVVNVPWFFTMHRLPLALMARTRGIDVHIACGEGAGREDIEAKGLPFHPLPLTRTPFAPIRDLRTIGALVRLYRELRPDVVHHVTLKPVIYGSIAARIAGIRGVLNAFAGLGSAFSTDSLSARVRLGFIEQLIRRALVLPRQKVVFENVDDCEVLTRACALRPGDSLVIPGVGVDIVEYTASIEPPTPVRVLLAGRMLRQKGVLYFVEAARRLRRRGIQARFVLAGAPDSFNPGTVTEEELRGWSREGVVDWLGLRTDMPRVIRDAHVVCLPSYYREGVPRILLEAAASGRALVTTDMPGCRDVVRHGFNGLIVPAHDVDALEQALERVIVDGELRARLGAAGRRMVEQEFALQPVLEQFWDVYRSLGLTERAR
jgi:glycosyltransferase involved in cell wall biosynthesis